MSSRVTSDFFDYYDEDEFGAPLVSGLTFADEADDRGRGITTPVEYLAAKSRQHPRTFQRHLRNLEKSGLLICDRPGGGAGVVSEYRLNLRLLMEDKNGVPRPKKTLAIDHRFEPKNGGILPGFSDDHIRSTTKDVEDVSNATVNADDQALAHFMFGALKSLNPTHREPRWTSWIRDLRLLRERDGRTHAEIRELFTWASADRFWQKNILSPNALRCHWDKLMIARGAEGGNGAQAPNSTDDGLCSRRFADGSRCTKPWTWRPHGGDPVCRDCKIEVESEGSARREIAIAATRAAPTQAAQPDGGSHA